jgi:hypothetical protein
MSYTQFTATIQTKLWQFCDKFKSDFSKAEHNFIKQMMFGILKSGRVEINSIARSLQESIPLKKVHKRLGMHLGKELLWKQLTQSTLEAQRSLIKQCRFIIHDLSDIQKNYAKAMEGLAWVHDGSKDGSGPGYWLSNISAVDEKGQTIIPLYSELYSHQAEVCSQNQKILDGINRVAAYFPPDAISVMDRGADRDVIMSDMLEKENGFIIRQNGKRKLFLNNTCHAFKEISRQVRLKYRHKVNRIHKNKTQQLIYEAGTQKVRLSLDGPELWLVVLKEKKRGYCWLLCHFKDIASEQEAVALALKGYGYRWKIEEVHRQLKQDYALEALRLQRYQALKTMNAMLWMALSFLYTRLDSIAVDIVYHPKLGLVNRKKFMDTLRFIYYKLAEAIKKILAVADCRLTKPRPPRNNRQTSLAFL